MPGAKERPASRRVARVPQVMQMEALECGAACLAMILAYYGRWVPLEQLRVDCGVSRDGSKATNILKAARSYGLAAKGMTYLANALMRKGSLPCIAFWNFNHFVVVKGCKGKNVYINDPARGEVKVPFDEFEESFTGVALVFEKTDAFEEGGKKPDMKVYARKLLSGLGGAVAFVMVTAAIVSLVTVLNTSLKRVNIARAGAMANGKLYATTIGGVEMIETIKAAGAEIGYFGRWAGYQAAANEANVRTAQLNEYMGLLPTLVMQVANIAVLTLGVWLIVLGQMTPGMVLAFSGFLSAFMAPVVQLIGLGQSIQEMQTQAERIEDVMRYEVDVPEEPVSGDAGEKALSFGRDKLAGRVDMENVTFGYSPLEPPVIEDFNLHMEPGKWVAFVGGSGCGKSTIAKVASGLYKPWSGTVKFDGTPVDEIPRAILRGSLAVVDQDIVTFDDTVSNNVKLWDKSIEDYEVIMAFRDAGIHDVVAARDGGYASRILPGGRNFSGGQLQRLEIARVLAQEPTVIVLDEATSALDAQTEAASFARLLTLPTSFFKQYSSGDLGSRISNVTMLAQMIASVLLGSGLTALFSLIYVAQIAVFAPVLALPALVSFVGMVGTIVIFYLAGSSHVAMADYMAFSVAYGQVNGAIMGFAGTASTMAQIKPMLNSVAPIMEAVPEVSEERPNVDSLTGSIDVSGVSFRYGENMPYIVKDLSFRIRPGEYVALVGRSGCGKSTIMRLLLGFETPERGTIFYGPHETSKVDLRSLRRHIGVVMQDGKLFMGDVANNITISNPTATIDDAWEAAELAGIADDIRRMPMGMQTLVTEGGGGVSGGQRQRLMIARAICGKKKILMFDEATSALDNRTQKHVSDSLDSLNCTRLVIAHRLSTVRHRDRILVVDGGSIVEEGTYDELLAQGGVFAELVSRQRLDAEA